MRHKYKFLIILFLGLNTLNVWAQEQQKQLLHKTYQASNKTLAINNTFGNLTVTTWAKQEYEVVVTLKTEDFSDKEIQEFLDKIEIVVKEGGDVISIETDWGHINQSTNGKKSFEVNYAIKTPSNASLDLENSFGNISIPDFTGPLKIKEEYGQLSAGELANAEIKISFAGGSIAGLKKGELKIMYADNLNIGDLGEVILETSYSKLEVASANTVELKLRYGNLKIGTLNSLEGSSAFSGLDIEQLSGKFILKAQYASGKLNIEHITPGFELIDIESKYSKVHLNFDANCKFTFSSEHKYGDLNYDKNIVIDTKDKGDFSSSYEGHLGTNNTTSSVYVSTSYGNASLNVN